MRTRLLIPAAVLLFGCSLHHRPVAPEPARGPARDSLFQLDQTRADSASAKGVVDGLLALLSPEVVFLRSGAPAVYGRDAARALFSATAGAPPMSLSWQPLGGGVSDDLRSAYTFGATVRVLPPRSAIRWERYIAYWERVRGQPWQIVAYAEIDAPSALELNPAREALAPRAQRATKAVAEAIANVRAADSLFSDLTDRMGVAYAFANTIAPDGVVFGTPQLVIGPKAAQEFYAAQGTGTAFTWHPVYASAAGSLDLAFTIGEYSATSRGPSGAVIQRFGKYLTVWKRQADGSWKLLINGGNGTPSNR